MAFHRYLKGQEVTGLLGERGFLVSGLLNVEGVRQWSVYGPLLPHFMGPRTIQHFLFKALHGTFFVIFFFVSYIQRSYLHFALIVLEYISEYLRIF